jgi:sterol desaturase/sphingolipid hydroxylase (fatty acid hydroxylase superfamily)
MGILAHVLSLLQVPGLLITLPSFLVGLLVERLAPAEPRQKLANLGLNLGYALFAAWLGEVSSPLLAGAALLIVNALGGGLIRLPDQGWALVGSAALFVFAMDFLEYVFHRAQHTFPVLWAMHSLHHSDPAVNVTTATRAFWLEGWIKAIFLYPIVGVLFQVSSTIYTIYAVCKLYDFINHLNLRVHFGRFWVVLNGPQYHRIHHSTRPEHFNRNFAAFFPVFDWIFGTHYRPMPNEFPSTGLDTGEAPRHLIEAVIWPLRGRVLQRQGL